MEHDESIFDCAGDSVKVQKCTYTRLAREQGRVMELSEGYGKIDLDILFNVDLVEGPPAKVGDIVDYTAIECKVGNFNMRCLKLSVAQQVNDNRMYDPRLFMNKNEIIITDQIEFIFNEVEEKGQLKLIIKNEGKKVRKVSKPKLKSPALSSQLTITPMEEATLNPGESFDYKVTACSRYYGKSEEVFVFCVDGNFDIARKIKINVGGSLTVCKIYKLII